MRSGGDEYKGSQYSGTSSFKVIRTESASGRPSSSTQSSSNRPISLTAITHVTDNRFPIPIQLTKGAHNHIRADSGISGNIAVRIVDLNVGRIVTSSHFTLLNCCFDELLELR